MEIGEIVLLKTEYMGKAREYVATVSYDSFHTDLGIIDMDILLDKEPGDTVTSHINHEFHIRKLRTLDIFNHAKRTGAPMMPRDIGIIITNTGINKNDVVLDVGTGTGILAMYIGSIAKRVVTYESNEEFFKVSRKNINSLGSDNIELRHGNLVDEIEHINEQFDVITLDTVDAGKIVPYTVNLLRPGGYLAVYSPFFEQTKQIREAVDNTNFIEVSTVECIERKISFTERGTRPASSRVGHTGFITIART